MKEPYKYVILGAGPAGLSFAHSLVNRGEESFVVLEQEATAGGLCRSEEVDGAPVDIGSGHFLDVTRSQVLELLFQYMPRHEWNEFTRKSTIKIRGIEIDYPFEANLWQLPIDPRLDFLESISQAGCVRGLPMPESFEQWITWKLGERIAEEYMLPYNRKIWSIDLDQLGTYWLYKLPDVSFRQTLQSCLENTGHRSVPAHGAFLYPKHYGYGEIWRRMGDMLGDKLLLSTPVMEVEVDVSQKLVNKRFQAQTIVSSIPWSGWVRNSNAPRFIVDEVRKLRHCSIDVGYEPDSLPTDAHWVYDPDENVTHHRALCRSNFFPGSKGYWTEANSSRADQRADQHNKWRHRNEHAYPLNTRDKPQAVKTILQWARSNAIVGLGRWGNWEHANSDVVVAEAIETAKRLTTS